MCSGFVCFILQGVGIPSFFIDANEASHGSLGAIEKNDILVLISYSGETPELKNINPKVDKYSGVLISFENHKADQSIIIPPEPKITKRRIPNIDTLTTIMDIVLNIQDFIAFNY